ncbi:hypothetical protein QE152_g25918 [Popillia japonica]|uniref:Uncharacterized protein n=1 Tax=Popillia japonica TaxID=7064 RepID=A0AAW1K049_POPJA
MSAATMTRRIDFNNPMINKPSNLQNSAVLRMLEEEENRKRSGQPGSTYCLRMLEEEENRKRSGQPGSLKRVAWPPPNSELEEFIEQEAIHSQGAPQNQAPAPQRYQVPVKQVEPPPSTITLRPQAPVSQAPPPLVTSQPATATLRGGKHLRGDLKWPPENVREKMAAEEQHLIELSQGPAVRPRKNCKDYSSFFAKHALTHAYPGYKIPPGTQFYDHNPVM